MTSPESDQTLAFRAQHLDAGATAPQIARLVERVCHEISLALVPIVGQRGVAALFARSLQLSAKSHPWLSGLSANMGTGMSSGKSADGMPAEFNPSALSALIATQPRSEAAVGACHLLQTFFELLAKLVGRSLTERLLRTPWLIFLSGTAAQDNTQ